MGLFAMTDTLLVIPDTFFQPSRLDRAIAALWPELSRSRIKKLIEEGGVKVDNHTVDEPARKVKTGQTISFEVPDALPAEPAAQDIPLDIVYEDKDLLVLNKHAGLVVHPAAGHADGTLVNALLHHCGASLSGIGGVKRPGIVHRLDKDTSGLMLVAKNDAAHAGLSKQLADRTMSRTYQALVWGILSPPKGKIDAPIARNPHNRFFMSVRPDGRAAVTHYKTLEKFGVTASLVECKLESGRTHQIRVHMAHIKHSVLGDPLYGIQKTAVNAHLKRAGIEGKTAELIGHFPRQALHATALHFVHPRTENEMRFEVNLSKDIKGLLKIFQNI